MTLLQPHEDNTDSALQWLRCHAHLVTELNLNLPLVRSGLISSCRAVMSHSFTANRSHIPITQKMTIVSTVNQGSIPVICPSVAQSRSPRL